MTNNAGGISFKEALQEALAEEDSAESDLAPTAIEVVSETETPEVEQPEVESNEDVGLFEDMFIEKEEQEEQPDTDSLKFEVDGRLLTLAELKSGYMRQADYTRKTQELSTLRAENEKAIVLWRALQEKPQETWQALGRRIGTGQPLTEAPQVQPQAADIEALVAQKVAEALGSNPQVQAFEAEQAWATVNVIFDKIENDYKVQLAESDKEQVLRKAQALDTEDIEYAFWTMWQEKQKRDAQRRNAEQNSTKQGIASPNDANVPQQKVFGSFRDAMRDTLAEEQVVDTEFLFN